jgi:hypothetical protein
MIVLSKGYERRAFWRAETIGNIRNISGVILWNLRQIGKVQSPTNLPRSYIRQASPSAPNMLRPDPIVGDMRWMAVGPAHRRS